MNRQVFQLLTAVVIASCGVCDAAPPKPVRAAHVREAARWQIIGRDLSARPATIRSIGEDSLTATDGAGKQQVVPLSDVIAIMPVPTHLPVRPAGSAMDAWRDPTLDDITPQGRLELADGQIFPGQMSPAKTKGEQLVWTTRELGDVTVPLESVRALSLRPSVVTGEVRQGAGDLVLLANGDRAEGFVASMGPKVDIESQGKTRSLDPARVAAVLFANKTVRAQGAWVWLTSGTVCAVEKLAFDANGKGELNVRLPGVKGNAVKGNAAKAVASIETADIRAVSFDVTRLIPVASEPITSKATCPERRWTPEPIIGDVAMAPLGAADIELPGPMSISWDAAGAVRLSGVAELPKACRAWGDCDVTIELTGQGPAKPLWHQHLKDSQPEAMFNIMIPEGAKGQLTVRVDAGQYGPILDRVILRRPLMLRK